MLPQFGTHHDGVYTSLIMPREDAVSEWRHQTCITAWNRPVRTSLSRQQPTASCRRLTHVSYNVEQLRQSRWHDVANGLALLQQATIKIMHMHEWPDEEQSCRTRHLKQRRSTSTHTTHRPVHCTKYIDQSWVNSRAHRLTQLTSNNAVAGFSGLLSQTKSEDNVQFPLLLLTKNPELSSTPCKIFQDLFGAGKCLYVNKNDIYLQYSQCSSLQKIQHEAKCGCSLFRIQMNWLK